MEPRDGRRQSGRTRSLVDWVSGEDERDDIVFLNPKDGKRTADDNGVSTIYVIGNPQKEDLTRRKVLSCTRPPA